MSYLFGKSVILTSSTDIMAILTSLLPMLALLAISYFLLIKPEKKRKLEYQSMLADLKVNDEILTKGGIVAKIIKMDDGVLVIESGPERVRIRVVKEAVMRKMESSEPITVEES